MRGLDWQTLHLPLAVGLNQKADSRAMAPPALARCVDVQFDEVGGLQTRHPFIELGDHEDTDGDPITDMRRVVAYGDRLLLFTKDSLYSWNAQLQKWAPQGTHLAVKVTEKNVFVTGKEQVECDRAELDGLVVCGWTETEGVTTVAYVAAFDKETGSLRMAPTSLGASTSRVRVVALSTKILVTVVATTSLVVFVVDPLSPGTALAGAGTTLTAACDDYYDITRVASSDVAVFAARLSPDTSYLVGTVTAGGVVATATPARTCDGPIAVSSEPDGTHVQVARIDGTDVEGDLILLSDLSDVYTAQAIGSFAGASCDQITAAHKSVTDGGFYRCHVFWSSGRDTDGVASWVSESNWVSTGNTLGTAATFLNRLDVGSRAFCHDGRVYLWMIWGTAAGTYGGMGELQNASYLYRDDGFLVAKSTWNRGGGFLTAGHLPGVANIDDDNSDSVYAYCGSERTVFGELASNNFTGRRPRDVVFTFDSNEARRTAQSGKTLYIAGGEILQYDGERLTEVGFHVWPWYVVLSKTAGGSVGNGTYGYKFSYRSDNAQAERDRSASIYIATTEVTSAPDRVVIEDLIPLYVTHKPAVAVEAWRTLADQLEDASYYLVTSSDPSSTSNPQRYLANDTTQSHLADIHDERVDDDADDFGTHPQDVTLPSLAPPAASIIIATETRVFLAGVAGEPNSVYYSKQRGDGEVAAFHGSLFATVPAAGGAITALSFLNETLVVFRENAIYMLPGDGFDNTMNGTNYGPARTIATDVGAVNHESVAITERGLVFKSNKGWYLLSKGWSLEYIGAPVADYDDDVPVAVHVIEGQHQIRILSLLSADSVPPHEMEGGGIDLDLNPAVSRMLVLDTHVGQWGEWTVQHAIDACMWDGVQVLISNADEVKYQLTSSHVGVDYGLDIETGWIKLADLQGFGRVRWFEVLGEYRSAHRLRVRVARDYWADGEDEYFDDSIWTPTPATFGKREKVRHSPSIQQCEAIKIRLTAINVADDDEAPDGEALKLTGISLELGFKRGLFRHLPAAQKQ